MHRYLWLPKLSPFEIKRRKARRNLGALFAEASMISEAWKRYKNEEEECPFNLKRRKSPPALVDISEEEEFVEPKNVASSEEIQSCSKGRNEDEEVLICAQTIFPTMSKESEEIFIQVETPKETQSFAQLSQKTTESGRAESSKLESKHEGFVKREPENTEAIEELLDFSGELFKEQKKESSPIRDNQKKKRGKPCKEKKDTTSDDFKKNDKTLDNFKKKDKTLDNFKKKDKTSDNLSNLERIKLEVENQFKPKKNQAREISQSAPQKLRGRPRKASYVELEETDQSALREACSNRKSTTGVEKSQSATSSDKKQTRSQVCAEISQTMSVTTNQSTPRETRRPSHSSNEQRVQSASRKRRTGTRLENGAKRVSPPLEESLLKSQNQPKDFAIPLQNGGLLKLNREVLKSLNKTEATNIRRRASMDIPPPIKRQLPSKLNQPMSQAKIEPIRKPIREAQSKMLLIPFRSRHQPSYLVSASCRPVLSRVFKRL